MTDVHVCLVSGQATPNLTPILDPDFRPQEVVLIVSPDMQRQADWLAEVIRQTGLAVSCWPIADAYDVTHMQDRLLELLALRDDQRLSLNVTGGTKLMAIAAHEVFAANGQAIFYVHPELDRVIWLSPRKKAPVDLKDRIKLGPFLAAHGRRIVQMDRQEVAGEGKALTRQLIQHVGRYATALHVLNGYSMSAKRDLRSIPVAAKHYDWPEFQALVSLFQEHHFLQWEGDRLFYPSEQAHFFVAGGWLEAHVFQVLNGLRQTLAIQDLARGLEAISRQSRNELDVVFLAGNRLHIVECKTRRFSAHDDPEAGKGAETLYKLDHIRDFGGIQTRTMLVSFRALGPADRQRAHDLKIKTVEGQDIQQMEGKLREWINGSLST